MTGKYITPAVTAFTGNGQLDEDTLTQLYDKLIQGGVSGILVLGSIGEFFGISLEKRKQLVQLAVRHINGRVPLLVGTGGMDVEETTALSRFSFAEGADGVVVISPFYFGLDPQTVEAYYSRVASACPGDVYLYNFPDRTGYDLSSETVLRLAQKHENIVGCKDTLSGMAHTRQMIQMVKAARPDFQVFSGFDDNFAHNLLSGGDGCIGGLSNVVPELCGAWIQAFARMDLQAVGELQRRMDTLMDIYQVGKPFIPYIKSAIRLRGIPIEDQCAFPSPLVTATQEAEVGLILERAAL